MGSDNSNASEAHHYIPKFYLKGFMDKDHELWVYEKNATAPRRSTPKMEGHRENYYTFDDFGLPDSSTERMLSRTESLAAPIFKKLANPQFEITNEQREMLYSFIALMFVRVPAYREYINKIASDCAKRISQEQARDRDSFYAFIRRYEAQTGQTLGDLEELRRFAASDNYTVTQRSVGFNLLLTFGSFFPIAKLLETEFRHDLYYSPQSSPFLTCDNPIATIEPQGDGTARAGVGFSRPGTQIVYPLNKRSCVILSRGARGEKISVNEKRVRMINDAIMAYAQRYVYASVGTRRLARISNERGFKIKYGENAFLHTAPPR
jgi:hypothetical protein